MLNQRQDVESTLIQCLFNFWLQERLSLPVLCVHGDDDEHGYECSYLEPIEGRSGWFSIEQKYCDYGCCGDLYEQKCCTKEEIDQ